LSGFNVLGSSLVHFQILKTRLSEFISFALFKVENALNNQAVNLITLPLIPPIKGEKIFPLPCGERIKLRGFQDYSKSKEPNCNSKSKICINRWIHLFKDIVNLSGDLISSQKIAKTWTFESYRRSNGIQLDIFKIQDIID
jgi:hypothetical protein